MSYTKNKIKFLSQYSKLLKIAFFIICSIFFTTGNADLSSIGDRADKLESGTSYFLDISSLQASYDSGGLITHYVEKENHDSRWVFLPIKSSMRDYYKTVANVVATEIHRRIDKYSLVPITKFLIKKNIDNDDYQLLGCAYKKISSTTPILERMKKKDLDDYSNNVIYRDQNVERNVGIWRYLGLPTSPDFALLELSEDNKLVRYDYYKSFQYNNLKIHEQCFRTSYFPISGYKCDVEYIRNFEQEIRSKHKETLKKIISEIRTDSNRYLKDVELDEVSQALENIMQDI